MEPQRRRIDIISEPGFLTGIADIDIEEVRRRRAMCRDVEQELSYYRRLLHGRLDLLAYERRRRAGIETTPLIEALPSILGDTRPGSTRSANVAAAAIASPEFEGPGRRSIDYVLGDDFLARLSDLGDDELDQIEDAIAAAEQSVSRQRSTAQHAHDALSAEIGRRYRQGLTSVDELLNG